MEKNTITGKYILKRLQRNLQRSSFLKKVGMKKKDMQGFLAEMPMQALADDLAAWMQESEDPGKDVKPIDCRQLLEVCRPYLMEAGERACPGFNDAIENM